MMKKKTESIELLFPLEKTTVKTKRGKNKSSNMKMKYVIVISLICVILTFCAYGGIIVLMDKNQQDINTNSLQITEKEIAIKDILVSDLIIEIGEIKKPNFTLTPKNAKDKNLKWSIENSAIASVNINGEVTGITNGETNLKISTKDEKIVVFAKVKVVVFNKERCILGDTNNDGILNNLDILFLTNYINSQSYNNQIKKCIDINNDTKIDLLDLVELKKIIKT